MLGPAWLHALVPLMAVSALGLGAGCPPGSGVFNRNGDGANRNGTACGGIAGLGCAADGYCRLEPGNCCCDQMGVCTTRPTVCPLVFAPVCGCDGVTYGNECEAAAAGMNVDHSGECQ